SSCCSFTAKIRVSFLISAGKRKNGVSSRTNIVVNFLQFIRFLFIVFGLSGFPCPNSFLKTPLLPCMPLLSPCQNRRSGQSGRTGKRSSSHTRLLPDVLRLFLENRFRASPVVREVPAPTAASQKHSMPGLRKF